MDRDPDLLTATEAGAILGRSSDAIRRWANNPNHPLRGYRHGAQQLLFRRTDIEALRDRAADARGRAAS
jgi:hypothetical protein